VGEKSDRLHERTTKRSTRLSCFRNALTDWTVERCKSRLQDNGYFAKYAKPQRTAEAAHRRQAAGGQRPVLRPCQWACGGKGGQKGAGARAPGAKPLSAAQPRLPSEARELLPRGGCRGGNAPAPALFSGLRGRGDAATLLKLRASSFFLPSAAPQYDLRLRRQPRLCRGLRGFVGDAGKRTLFPAPWASLILWPVEYLPAHRPLWPGLCHALAVRLSPALAHAAFALLLC
jgi:hypothetical protein